MQMSDSNAIYYSNANIYIYFFSPFAFLIWSFSADQRRIASFLRYEENKQSVLSLTKNSLEFQHPNGELSDGYVLYPNSTAMLFKNNDETDQEVKRAERGGEEEEEEKGQKKYSCASSFSCQSVTLSRLSVSLFVSFFFCVCLSSTFSFTTICSSQFSPLDLSHSSALKVHRSIQRLCCSGSTDR